MNLASGTSNAHAMYELTGDLGTTASAAICFNIDKYTDVSCNGRTIHGIVNILNPDGVHLFNCIFDTDQNVNSSASIRVICDPCSAMTQPLLLHDIYIRNTGNSEEERRSIMVNYNPTAKLFSGPGIRITHTDLYGQHCVGCSRQTAVFIQTYGLVGVDFSFNKIGMSAQADAFKGVICYGTDNCSIHNNFVNLPNFSGSQDGTAFEVDDFSIRSGNHNIYSNYCLVRNNRCWRPRNNQVVHIYDNNVTLDDSVGMNPIGAGFYGILAATTGPAGQVLDMTGSVVENNTYRCGASTACYIHMVWAAKGIYFKNETVIGTGGSGIRYGFIQNISTGSPTLAKSSGANNTFCGINAPANATINTESGNTTTYGAFTNSVNPLGSGSLNQNNACAH